ncbi:hypothetical protein NPIL_103041, partial [Nephila pilipes]
YNLFFDVSARVLDIPKPITLPLPTQQFLYDFISVSYNAHKISLKSDQTVIHLGRKRTKRKAIHPWERHLIRSSAPRELTVLTDHPLFIP